MSAKRWMQELEMLEKARQDVLAKEKAQAAEEARITEESERRAWMRELVQVDGCLITSHSESGG